MSHWTLPGWLQKGQVKSVSSCFLGFAVNLEVLDFLFPIANSLVLVVVVLLLLVMTTTMDSRGRSAAHHLSTRSTLWLLPKGRNAQSEVEDVTRAWQGVFHVEQSLTQAESAIVIAREVRPR